jgi:hypothetical protein
MIFNRGVLICRIKLNDECLKTICSRKYLDLQDMNEVGKLYYITKNFVNYTDLEIKRIKIGCASNAKENRGVHKNFDGGTSWKI